MQQQKDPNFRNIIQNQNKTSYPMQNYMNHNQSQNKNMRGGVNHRGPYHNQYA